MMQGSVKHMGRDPFKAVRMSGIGVYFSRSPHPVSDPRPHLDPGRHIFRNSRAFLICDFKDNIPCKSGNINPNRGKSMEMVRGRSRVVKVDLFLITLHILNDSSQLKNNGQGGQGGQGGIQPITYARACFSFLFIYFSFIKKYLDHPDQTSNGGVLYLDRPPCPPLTTLTRAAMTAFSIFLTTGSK